MMPSETPEKRTAHDADEDARNRDILKAELRDRPPAGRGEIWTSTGDYCMNGVTR